MTAHVSQAGLTPAAAFPSPRGALALATIAAVAAASFAAPDLRAEAIDPDLVLVIRAMAAIKGGLAALALAACFWRLARPASAWRMVVYVAGPALMAAGTVALWRLEALGLAAVGLHLGLFAVLAAALTDPDFIAWPGRARRA